MYLICVLYYRLCKGGKIGKLPIIIAFLVLINGVAAIIRFHASFPAFTQGGPGSFDIKIFSIAFFIESLCFFGATWLFAMRFYEAVYGMECVLAESGLSSMVSSREGK